mgnify:CR=1 FL=1
MKQQIQELFDIPSTIVTTFEDKRAAFRASHAALAASGTVSLELAAAGLPAVIAYKLNPLTHFIVKRLVKVKFTPAVKESAPRSRTVPPVFLSSMNSTSSPGASPKPMKEPVQ